LLAPDRQSGRLCLAARFLSKLSLYQVSPVTNNTIGKERFIRHTHTSNIFHETSHHGFGDAIPPKSCPVAGFKATQTHCGYFHCQFP